jgi:hypothetical protein
MLSIDLDIGNVVFEDSGDVNLDAMLAIVVVRFGWVRCGEEGSPIEGGSPGIGEPNVEAVCGNAGFKHNDCCSRCENESREGWLTSGKVPLEKTLVTETS